MTLLQFLEHSEPHRSAELAKHFMREVNRAAQACGLTQVQLAELMWPPSFRNVQRLRIFLADPNPEFDTLHRFCRVTGDLIPRIQHFALRSLEQEDAA